jgi:hypothetical protein
MSPIPDRSDLSEHPSRIAPQNLSGCAVFSLSPSGGEGRGEIFPNILCALHPRTPQTARPSPSPSREERAGERRHLPSRQTEVHGEASYLQKSRGSSRGARLQSLSGAIHGNNAGLLQFCDGSSTQGLGSRRIPHWRGGRHGKNPLRIRRHKSLVLRHSHNFNAAGSFMEGIPYIEQHPFTVAPPLVVPETQFMNALAFEEFLSCEIMLPLQWQTMRETVQLNRQLRQRTIEVQTISTYRMLTAELESSEASSAECLPELPFLPRLSPTRMSGIESRIHKRYSNGIVKTLKPYQTSLVSGGGSISLKHRQNPVKGAFSPHPSPPLEERGKTPRFGRCRVPLHAKETPRLAASLPCSRRPPSVSPLPSEGRGPGRGVRLSLRLNERTCEALHFKIISSALSSRRGEMGNIQIGTLVEVNYVSAVSASSPLPSPPKEERENTSEPLNSLNAKRPICESPSFAQGDWKKDQS